MLEVQVNILVSVNEEAFFLWVEGNLSRAVISNLHLRPCHLPNHCVSCHQRVLGALPLLQRCTPQLIKGSRSDTYSPSDAFSIVDGLKLGMPQNNFHRQYRKSIIGKCEDFDYCFCLLVCFQIYFIFIYVYVHVHISTRKGQKRETDPLGARNTGTVSWELSLGPLKEQQAVPTSEPSPQPHADSSSALLNHVDFKHPGLASIIQTHLTVLPDQYFTLGI